MSEKFNNNDFIAMDFACRALFAQSYAEFMSMLVEVGNLLLASMQQQNGKIEELSVSESMPLATPTPIGFQVA
jgi:hypothetical protein